MKIIGMLSALLVVCTGCSKPEDPVEVSTSETVMRSRVQAEQPLPVFNQGVLAGSPCGLVILRVTLAKNGHIVSIKPVESPSPEASVALQRAVESWQFKPLQDERRFMLSGNFSFYLLKEGPKIRTFNPREVDYVGICNSIST